MNRDRNSYFDIIKENRIKGFRKSFDKIRAKLKTLKGNIVIDDNTNETDLINDPFYTEESKVDLPDIKLNINNVFSRLYYNEVLLQSEDVKIKIPKRRNNSTLINSNIENNTSRNNRNKIQFKLKNALKSTYYFFKL